MKMMFIGKDRSMGYRLGHIYDLEIKIMYGMLHIMGPTYCPYGSMEAFLKNWSQL
jgi:hypothetical protein